jgi:hypothetical protein
MDNACVIIVDFFIFLAPRGKAKRSEPSLVLPPPKKKYSEPNLVRQHFLTKEDLSFYPLN